MPCECVCVCAQAHVHVCAHHSHLVSIIMFSTTWISETWSLTAWKLTKEDGLANMEAPGLTVSLHNKFCYIASIDWAHILTAVYLLSCLPNPGSSFLSHLIVLAH